MDLYSNVKEIKTQEEFIVFLEKLIKNKVECPQDWENDNIESFLEGIHGYCCDKIFENLRWQDFAEILLAGRVYE